jgi:uncharacterized OB-fold protein
MRSALPTPTPETLHYWEGCKAHQLRLQRCRPCAHVYFPPRAFCPKCGGRQVEVFAASGKGTLHTYIINHRPRPDMGKEPHSIAVVQLEEGPRMLTNIVNCPQTPEALVLDMPVRVVFEIQNDEITLPLFEPAEGERRP